MFQDLLNDLLNDSKNLEVMVESELVSKKLKSLVLNDRAVVSERDISTLDYNLSRMAVQEQGLRVLDDFFYPYLMSESYELGSVDKALGLVKTFYDIYTDTEVLTAVIEYIEKNPEFKSAGDLFKLSSELIVDAVKSGRLPRSFTRLLLRDLNITKQHAFLNEDLDYMPSFFKEQVLASEGRVYQTGSFKWSGELDLYENSWSNDLSFQDFSDPISETRWALAQLKEHGKGLNIFYPPNMGYENLFLTYQKEFFEEQVFYTDTTDQFEIRSILGDLSHKVKDVSSKYDGKDSNYIEFIKIDGTKITLENFITEFLGFSSINNNTLNFISEIQLNLEDNFELNPKSWCELLEKKYLRELRKKGNLISEYGVYKYGEPPKERDVSSLVLGWGQEIFKPQSQSWIAPQLASRLENDLGLKSKSLFKSSAHDLIRFLPLNSSNIVAMFPRISLKGESRHQGLLKTLKSDSVVTKAPKRDYKTSELVKENTLNNMSTIRLSSSSLNTYYSCPKKYYLEKAVGLKKEELPDYLISPRDEGSLLHKVMEEIDRGESFNFEAFKAVVGANIEKDKEFESWRNSQVQKIAERLWPFFKREIEFIQANSITPLHIEKEFKFYIDLENKSLSLNETNSSIAIRGTIDRVDQDQDGNILLYDYKRSSTGSYAVSTYKKTSPLNPQAFVYYLAATLGCLGEYQNIIGFQFINLTLGKREKGFLFKETLKETSLVCEKTGAVDKLKFDEKLDIFKERLFQIVSDIKDQEFEAKPIKDDECSKCDWRGICKESTTFI